MRRLAGPLSVVAAALLLAAAGIPYGIRFGDEGFYLATAQGPLLGAVPFRDDLSQAGMWFFLVLTPVLWALPDGGTLLQVRALGLLIRAACSLALLAALRRQLPPPLLAIAFATALLTNWTPLIPSYNSLPFEIAFVGLAAWMHGASRPTPRAARGWGALAGACFALAGLCLLPRLALAGLPLAVAAWKRRAPTPEAARLRQSALSCAVTMLGLVALALGTVAALGLVPDLLRGLAFLSSSRAFAAPLTTRLAALASIAPTVIASAFVHALFWGAALRLGPRAVGGRPEGLHARVGLGLLALAYGAAAAGLYHAGGERWYWAYSLIYSGLCWLPLLAYPLLRSRLALGPDEGRAAGLLFASGAAQQALAALFSSQGVAAGIPGVLASLALLLLLVKALARRHSPTPASADAGAVLAAGALGVALAVTAVAFHHYPDQDPFAGRLATFRNGRLAGLRSKPKYVKGWSTVVDYLAPRLERGELLLAHENVPLLYYATDTRPALGATYVSRFLYQPRQLEALLRAMLAAGRMPRYAVRLRRGTLDEAVWYSTLPERDPLNTFVLEHYVLEASLPLFDVYRRR